MTTETAPNVRPYAATANVLAVLNRIRSRNLPEILDYTFFRTAGLSDVVIGRVRQALRFLDFIDEESAPTERLRAYAAAADPQQILGDAVREAYRTDFVNTNPADDDQATILRAFQQYAPRSQTARMVMLFLGLCREGGIAVRDAPRERKMRPIGGKRDSARRQAPPMPKTSGGQQPRLVASPHVFGVTEDDIAALDEDEFNELWAAFGKVVRAKVRRKQEEESVEQLAEEPEEAPKGPES